MISTVTTTVTQLFPVTAASSIAVIILLMGLLIVRELAIAGGMQLRPVARHLMVAVLPLLAAFVVICVNRLFEVL